jgi:hypothetical protein
VGCVVVSDGFGLRLDGRFNLDGREGRGGWFGVSFDTTGLPVDRAPQTILCEVGLRVSTHLSQHGQPGPPTAKPGTRSGPAAGDLFDS